MHLVDILTDRNMIAEPASALSPRENPENRAAQSMHKQPICLSTCAGKRTAEKQDIEDRLLTRISRRPNLIGRAPWHLPRHSKR